MKNITLTVNGQTRALTVDPDETLSTVLRREGFKGVKVGCDEGVCGACTVIMDGKTVNSCHVYAFQADGRVIETIEVLGTFDQPHRLQQALADEGAVQCGFCTPGMILSAKVLLEAHPHPSEEQLKEHLDGNLCRCTGYEKIQSALRKVIGVEGDVP
jgi:aerobic-type carbon monoxide dehydrogenase small subunit (CoxS/CutS family)